LLRRWVTHGGGRALQMLRNAEACYVLQAQSCGANRVQRLVKRPLALSQSLLLAGALIAICPVHANAEALGAAGGQDASVVQTDSQQEDADYNGEDFTRPQRSFELRPEYRTSSGSGSRTEQWTEQLRYNSKQELGGSWNLGYLVQVPIVEKTRTSFDPPSTSYDMGFGGAVAQAALIQTVNPNWAYGFGARFVAPGEDMIGSGKWQIMPGFGVRYSFLESGPDTYFVPVVRYAISVAGDPNRRNISEPQMAPTLNVGLPNRWFVTLYPSNDIRINYGDPISGQTGRLFLPVDAAIGRNVTDKLVISFEAGVPIIDAYPVYKFKAELRLVLKF
jgi:hypothetical protein